MCIFDWSITIINRYIYYEMPFRTIDTEYYYIYLIINTL